MAQQSAMERTTKMAKPPVKSISVRCKTCDKLMKIKKLEMDDEQTGVKYSECHACRLAAQKKTVAGRTFFKKKSPKAAEVVSDEKTIVSCSRCKAKIEISFRAALKKSFLCPACLGKAKSI